MDDPTNIDDNQPSETEPQASAQPDKKVINKKVKISLISLAIVVTAVSAFFIFDIQRQSTIKKPVSGTQTTTVKPILGTTSSIESDIQKDMETEQKLDELTIENETDIINKELDSTRALEQNYEN